jgi:ADP-ribosylglycohydrolase
VYEARPIKTKNFPLFDSRCTFTDDSVLTIAVALAILSRKPYRDTVLEIGRRYPHAGYGGSFRRWLQAFDPKPYNSWGNGAAMRVSPVGFAFDTIGDVLEQARLTAEISHNHPEGIKGAQATALAVFLARTGHSKEGLREQISRRFGYDLQRSVDQIRPAYGFRISCQETVPEAIVAFLDSVSYEDALRNAVSLGGDSDTLACITGGIAEAYYGGVPEPIRRKVREILPAFLWRISELFCGRYPLMGSAAAGDEKPGG